MTSFSVDYFEVPAEDTAAEGDFFKKAFGWTTFAYGPDYTEIREGGVLGGINGDADDRCAHPVIGIRTDDIADAERVVTEAGGTITRPIYDYPGGQRFFFRAPGGAELMIYCPWK